MPKINPEIETFARIKVIGVGGSGGNAINHMIDCGIRGVEFISVNTDTQDLHKSQAKKKIHIGKNLTKGLGSGMDPDIGQKAAEETKEELQEAVKGADMLFIAGGMGGGTCSGAAPIIARVAKEEGALVVGVITKPFSFEGERRRRISLQALEALEKEVDALIVIPNDRLLVAATGETSFQDAFGMCDDVLRQAVEGISELITVPGIINIDYADIKAVMTEAGSAFMGVGRATGKDRAENAVIEAINSPLLDIEIGGAKGVLFAISGGADLTMSEVNSIAQTITQNIDPDAKVIFGAIRDNKLKKGEIKVTVIATGFGNGVHKKSLFSEKSKGKDVDISNEKADEIIDDTKDDDSDWSAIPAFLRRDKK